MKKRIPELDFIKGIAIILVIIGHVISQVWSNEPAVYEKNVLFRFCYSFHMPLFVFISGWICRITIKSDIGWLSKRIRRIGIPYILMIIIVFIILRNGSFSQFIASSPYWYLLFIIIADSILFLGLKLNYSYIAFAVSYALILLLNWKVPTNIGILRQLADFLPFYAFGTLIPELKENIKKYSIPALMISSLLYIALFPIYKHGISHQLEYFKEIFNTKQFSYVMKICIIGLNKFIIPVCGIALVFLITKALYSVKSTGIFRKALELTGCHTLAIYLLHDLFFVGFTGNSVINSVISAFAAFIIPLAISVSYSVFKKKICKDNL